MSFVSRTTRHLDKYNSNPIASIDHAEDVQLRQRLFRLFSPMSIARENLAYGIYSPDPMTINGITVWSASPIYVLGAHPSWLEKIPLELASRLQPEFVLGWNSLPDGLKEKIVAYILVDGTVTNPCECGRHASWFRNLRATPEIARLARDIYYRTSVGMQPLLPRDEELAHSYDVPTEEEVEKEAQMKRMEDTLRLKVLFGCSENKTGVVPDEQ